MAVDRTTCGASAVSKTTGADRTSGRVGERDGNPRGRPLLVGESNPYADDPKFALYPYPPQSAGARLCCLLGFTIGEYTRAFDRVNLLGRGERWSAPTARARAARILDHDLPQPRQIVALGARVAAAFGVAFLPGEVSHVAGAAVYVAPHPSGRSRLWNNPFMGVSIRDALLPLVAREVLDRAHARLESKGRHLWSDACLCPIARAIQKQDRDA